MNRVLVVLGCIFMSFAMQGPARAAEPQAGATRTIVLVRHGHYAADPTADENLGPHLTQLGVAQAHLAGAALMRMPVRFDHLYSSPMHRARDTAMVIAEDFPGRALQLVDDLAECNPPVRGSHASRDRIACKQQLDRVFARFFKPATAGDQADMLVCHGNVIRYLAARARGVDPRTWEEMSVGNASITTIRVGPDGRFDVVAVGDVDHVPLNMRTGTHADAKRNLAIPSTPEIKPAP